MTTHKTRYIEFGDNAADVDKGIADLILSLWKLDIGTCNSCENNVPKGFIWIEFLSAMDAENFLNIVANPYEDDHDSFYQHVVRCWRPFNRKEEDRLLKSDWIYSIHPHDDLDMDSDDDGDSVAITRPGPASIVFSVSIRFPRKHLPIVMERVQERLKLSVWCIAD